MILNRGFYMPWVQSWEHLLHGFIPGCLIALLIWKPVRILFRKAWRNIWMTLINAFVELNTFGVRITQTKNSLRSTILTSLIVAALAFGAGYQRGFSKGFMSGIAEVHSWTTTYYGVTVTWQDASDPLHYEFDLHDKDGKSLGRYKQHVCKEGSPSYYPSFRSGDYMDSVTFENKGSCWSFSTPDTNWSTPKLAKFITGVIP